MNKAKILCMLLTVIVLISLVACSNTAPSTVSTPSQNSTQPTPQVSNTDANNKYIGVYYDELIKIVAEYAADISTHIKYEQSDKDAMSMLRDELKERKVETGLVSINSELGAPGNLDYCVAVKTIDRGTVFLTILSGDLKLTDESERIQFVYLERGKKIGLIAAKFSTSNSYEWYENYLAEIYAYYDYAEYLDEYGKVIDKNKSQLDKIYDANEKIGGYIEDPPVATQYLSDSEYDRVNREFDRLIDLGNVRIDRYNNVYKVQYDEQVIDFNAELASADELSSRYPNAIYYVEEHFINNLFSVNLPVFSPITLPYFVVPQAYYTNYDSFLAALANMINADDSYQQIPKPDKSEFRFERITDKNFVVDSYKMYW